MTLKTKLVLLFLFLSQFYKGQWNHMSDLPDNTFALSVSFVIGNKAYLLNTNCSNELWEYNPANDTWTKKANFPGTCRFFSCGFAVNGKGYIGLGRDQLTQSQTLTDFWQYDPVTNNWTQKAQFPGAGRDLAVGFSIGNKGYLGTGYGFITQSSGTYYNDFWEYDPGSDTWVQKANVPGPARESAVGISLNAKGYVGLGNSTNPNTDLNDLYEYDPASNNWTQKQSMPSSAARGYASAFTINSAIYITGGIKLSSASPQALRSCLKFDLATDSWSYEPDFGGSNAFGQMAVTFSNTAYVGGGYNTGPSQNTPLSEWWKYEINTTGVDKTESEDLSFECFPNPADIYLHLKIPSSSQEAKFKLLSTDGILLMETEIDGPQARFDISFLQRGMYIAEMTSRKSTIRKKIIKD